jgi:hypothetical protein
MDRPEDDGDRIAAPKPYWRDIRVIGVVAFLVAVATWLMVSNGYWRTPEHLTIDGIKHAIWPDSGTFGSVIHHYLEAGSESEDIGISDGRPRPRTSRYWDAVHVWIAAFERAVRRWL